MGEKSHAAHGQRAPPHVQGVITVFATVGDPQEHVTGSERFPYVIAHGVQPEKRAQRGDVEKSVCKKINDKFLQSALTNKYTTFYY